MIGIGTGNASASWDGLRRITDKGVRKPRGSLRLQNTSTTAQSVVRVSGVDAIRYEQDSHGIRS